MLELVTAWLCPAAMVALVIFVILVHKEVKLVRRQEQGLCVGCGYDLRGLSEARCPECNTPFDPEMFKDELRP